MIEIRGLTVAFGAVTVIDALDAVLDAPVCGLIGPNGAGKTTLVNLLSGFVPARSGEVRVDGMGLLGMNAARRVRFGLRRSFQTEQVVEDLSVWDNVQSMLDHVPHRRDQADAQVLRALAHAGLLDCAEVPGAELDLFRRRMVEVAKALVGTPRLILFDEPGAGLDERESRVLRDAIAAIPDAFGAQVLLIDHDVDLIAAICTQTLVLDFGRRLALGATRSVLDDPLVRQAYLGA
ncbi:branched-chain amino acid ABC transporter ATP-binding protein [Pelomonas sp. Root1217]|uniref:ABC transporter ATP-binding protein n=1 Tax=Pelomonas sp. Root1217 TaxID=1736430 RepID=UPI00070C88DD|nr:ATP-binding cassette domain-containing protein [Pelomonas sp. Root1217]KQV48831.1 branched-chain amino acid ABC transporter ATP-binding protein [Pelomonas sp. Root1217]